MKYRVSHNGEIEFSGGSPSVIEILTPEKMRTYKKEAFNMEMERSTGTPLLKINGEVVMCGTHALVMYHTIKRNMK